MPNPIALLLLFPLAAGALLFVIKSKPLNRAVLALHAVIHPAASLMLAFRPCGFTRYFDADPLGIFFLLVLGVVYFGVGLYTTRTLDRSDISDSRHTKFTVSLILFVFAMTGVTLSTHAALLWVFVEATTLLSAPLIYFNRSKPALEAAWKYIFICSIGIALAFVGIILLSIGAGAGKSLFFRDLSGNAAGIAPVWLRLAFPFLLVGFGTKAGLAPVHAWLPDAHSEAPSAVSAMLSGTLLNMAFLGILRVYRIMEAADQAGYARTLLIVMGMLSVFVSAVFMVRVNNYKRMLAYSSIENMGIAALGIGIGGPGLFAAFLHLAAHSLSKAAFFLTSGNILRLYREKHIEGVRGILQREPLTGCLWIACFLAIAGLPPFPIFLSEFILVRAMFETGFYPLAAVFLILLTVIVFGMGNSVFRMAFGGEPQPVRSRPAFFFWAPQMLFLFLLAALGLCVPAFHYDLIGNAAAFF